ncbi:DUF3850 domain-containing protein [Vagococcus elongatus]|uniref:DUF3850 domain-containing protein n=1 Tax=Vagococcus elongatus TaxID=180344 RepID=A0A430AU59_9ENTE|nr:DUF3850 domain-containing protein [Vagococcus elongatus]RSU11590.1 hypothetical protein CBF29_07895 [Vagococcus elongatus]
MIHQLKVLPDYYQAVIDRRKTFEIRKNDRDFQVGDLVILKEFDGAEFTKRNAKAQITYICDYAQSEDYVVFSIKLIEIGSGRECQNVLT